MSEYNEKETELKIYEEFQTSFEDLTKAIDPLFKVKKEEISMMSSIEKAKYYVCCAYSVNALFVGIFFF
jgi:hypothetical protein